MSVQEEVQAAVSEGRFDRLERLLRRKGGLPGPRPNYELTELVGQLLTRQTAPVVAETLSSWRNGEPIYRLVAVGAVVERIAQQGRRGALNAKSYWDGLQPFAQDDDEAVRGGVARALVRLLKETGGDILSWFDADDATYFEMSVWLISLCDRGTLDAIQLDDRLLEVVDGAFEASDTAPRSAERDVALRVLRRQLPTTIAALALRHERVHQWLVSRADVARPASRDIVQQAAAQLARRGQRETVVGEVEGALAASAKPPRDPTRVIKGTRRRGRRKGQP